ncbi:hypothetical protein [Bradyrhizobium sp. AZCC 1678]|uniref:hypothetical protein n=1 Tax=Bradyrhizobium sp. AZCC 1678 TaxID=3117030 RepID=UPI002FF0F1AA
MRTAPVEVLGVNDTGQLAEQDGCGGGKGGAAPETWKHLFFLRSKLHKRSAASRIAVFGRAGGTISDHRSNSELE